LIWVKPVGDWKKSFDQLAFREVKCAPSPCT
jgi:hypothetical protein